MNAEKKSVPAWQCPVCKLWQTCSLSEHTCLPSEKSANMTVLTHDGWMPPVLSKPGAWEAMEAQDGIKVKEVTVHPADIDATDATDATAEATASLLMLLSDPKPTVGTKSPPGYGKDFALYDTSGTRLPPETVVTPGGYLLATNLPLEHPHPGVILPDIHTPKVVASVTVEKTSTAWIQKTIYTDGSMDCQTVNVPHSEKLAVKVTPPDAREKTLERDSSGGWRRRPRSRGLFDVSDMPRDKWAWLVECRKKMTVHVLADTGELMEDIVWGDFHKATTSPYGFGDEASALRRMIHLMREDRYNLGLGIVEYRVRPHYLGYTPKDEPWYAKTWTQPATLDRKMPLK